MWTKGEKKAKFGYDFWYQPYWDVMISTEWGAPKSFKKGFALPDTQDEGNSCGHERRSNHIGRKTDDGRGERSNIIASTIVRSDTP